jgi:hypothetical protein
MNFYPCFKSNHYTKKNEFLSPKRDVSKKKKRNIPKWIQVKQLYKKKNRIFIPNRGCVKKRKYRKMGTGKQLYQKDERLGIRASLKHPN